MKILDLAKGLISSLNPQKILAYVGGVAIAAAVGGFFGYRWGAGDVKHDWDQTIYEAQKVQTKDLVDRVEDTYKVGLIFEKESDDVRTVTREIIKKVPVYLPGSTTCPELPAGWGLLHDSAARGTLSGLPAVELHEAGAPTGKSQPAGRAAEEADPRGGQ